MGRAREVGWVAAGLMIGAGACYCVYKLTIGRDDNDKYEEEEEEEEWDDDQEMDEDDPDIWFDFTTMARPWSEDGDWTEPGAPGGNEDRPSGGGKANRMHPGKQRPFPYKHKNTWSAESFKNVTCVLGLSKCPSIQGEMWLAQPTDAGFSFSHTIGSHLASLSCVGNTLPIDDPAVKEKAFCALDKLHASVENQGQIKMYLDEVYQEAVSHCRNSFLQQAGLSLFICMTVMSNMLAKAVSDLKGSGCAEVQVLKPLVGLPEKPGLAGALPGAHVLLAFMSLFTRNRTRQVLLDTVAS